MSLMFRLLLAAGFLGLLGPAAFAEFGQRPERPNIVFILADDLGYGDLGCYGQEVLDTPRLDRMAAEGIRFTQHYAGSTVCAPSRACLLTGQHTGHVHQRANGEISFRPNPLDPCLAAWLGGVGYKTAMIGKSGLACRSKDAELPNAKGFEHFFGYLDHSSAHRYYPRLLWRNGRRVDYPENQGKSGETYSGEEFLGEALGWIEKNSDRPFFLHLPLQQPHLDLSAPPAWRERYLGRFDETPVPPGFYRGETHPKATFAGMVAYLDHTVGRVLDKLDELGIAEQTLVLFSSDNGAVNEGGWSRDHFKSSGPLRGHKRDLYEGGIRVPLIARWPGVIPPGRTTDHLSAHWDFAPTACHLAGIEDPIEFDGLSYTAELLGQGLQAKHEYLYWEFYEQGGKQAVRSGDWKAVRVDALKENPGPIELYDLATDLGEQHNVAAEHPEVVQRLARRMVEAHRPTSDHQMPAPAEAAE